MDHIGGMNDVVHDTLARLEAPSKIIERQLSDVVLALKNATEDSEISTLPSKEDLARIDEQLQFLFESDFKRIGELKQLKGLYIALLDLDEERREQVLTAIDRFEHLKTLVSSIHDTAGQNSQVSVNNTPLSPPKYHDSILADGIDQICKPTTIPESRLVIIGNIPEGIPPSQIIKGVCGRGGLLYISMFQHHDASTGGKSVTALQFRFASAASAYAELIRKNPIYYLDAEGNKHRADVQHVQTSSFSAPYSGSPINGLPLRDDAPSGRCVGFSHFPEACVWDFINRIGLDRIIDLSYEETDHMGKHGILIIELGASFDARHLCRKVQEDGFDYYTVGGENDGNRGIRLSYCDSDRPDGLLGSTNDHCIPHIPADHLTLKWNHQPWNKTRGISSIWKVMLRKPETFCNPNSCLPVYYVGSHYYIRDREIRKQHRRNAHQDVSLDQEDIDRLLATTLHNPSWATLWDKYFDANQKLNLRKCDEYAMIANHRRLKAEEQGLGD
ncbi:hypothetical protein B0J13DRAFT_606044 [Dactylonectria estremocensis]|uniref:RRM domain-containing protein n=1 Tax=Dactylonectria estremocensis TaxID=1079267 RepID=A0A9P9J9H5_9HYPO|nr:hypothetical protein B0J13DRAFT_606044 [Dactylonectria estremocensis]